MIRQATFGVMMAAVCLGAEVALALPADLVDRAERATALVDIRTSTGRGFGSAFCISDKGVFVTDGHVVFASTKKIKVIIRPGEKDQHAAIAQVLGIDYDADLAVMQLENPGQIVSLTLGNSDGVSPTQEVTAFGYPFGNMLSIDQKSYPSVTVNSGKITALRKQAGDLRLIQVDALVNPGDSGGPVLDADGRVIGIVESGVPGAGLNFATPVARLKKMLQDPLVLIDPIQVDYAQRNKAQNFSIHVCTLSHDATDYDLDFKITDPRGGSQTASGKTAGGKCDLSLTPTTDEAPLKWNPFAGPPPVFKFTLTLKSAGKLLSTQQGDIYITNPPLGQEKIRNVARAGGGNNGGGSPKTNQMDPLPADAQETAVIGSEKATEFREVSDAEDLAIGVRYAVGQVAGNATIEALHLLYAKPAGGKGHTIMAKPGYVVGGLTVNTGQFFRGFQVIFIRQADGKLDAKDTYTSDWVGDSSDGKTTQLAGNGERIIGICGRKGTMMRAIGLVVRKAENGATTQPSSAPR